MVTVPSRVVGVVRINSPRVSLFNEREPEPGDSTLAVTSVSTTSRRTADCQALERQLNDLYHMLAARLHSRPDRYRGRNRLAP